MKPINTTNINEARKQIEKLKRENSQEKIAILSQDDEFNRKAIEIRGLNLFVINEELNQKDYMKQRNSGLNEVLAKIASKNNISVGIDMNHIVRKESKEKAKSLARLGQNIMLCKKAGCRLILINSSNLNSRKLQSLLLVLGASTKQAETALKQPF